MLSHLSTIIIHYIQSFSYPAVFIFMLLESLLIPIPSEITMPFAGFLALQGHVSLVLVIFVGAAGNLAGSLLAYALGYYLEESVVIRLIEKYGKFILLQKHEYEKAMVWFRKYGNSITFLSRLLPGIRTFISLPAGLAEMNIVKFSLYTFAGSLIWSASLAYIGFYLGKNWESIHGIFSKLHYVIIAAVVAVVAYYIYRHCKNKKIKT